MSKKPATFDLSAVDQANEEYVQREEQLLQQRRQEHSRWSQREAAARELLAAILEMEYAAADAQQGGDPFDHEAFAESLPDAFFRACAVVREQGLADVLNVLDESRMVAYYGKKKDAALDTACYRAAVEVLSKTLAAGESATLARELAGTLKTSGGRHVWHMLRPIIQGLLVKSCELFRTDTIQEDPSAPAAAAVDPPGASVAKKRPCHDRDHLWLRWHEEERMGPAAIRDRWNQGHQHPDDRISADKRGRATVITALKKARCEKKSG